jgi:hypothetical protein
MKKKKSKHYIKPFKKQFFEPRNKTQEEKADEIIHSHFTQPLNKNTNCYSILEQGFSTIDGVSNKEFYANRRNKQERYYG